MQMSKFNSYNTYAFIHPTKISFFQGAYMDYFEKL